MSDRPHVQPESLYLLQGFQIGVCYFCTLKLTKTCAKMLRLKIENRSSFVDSLVNFKATKMPYFFENLEVRGLEAAQTAGQTSLQSHIVTTPFICPERQ